MVFLFLSASISPALLVRPSFLQYLAPPLCFGAYITSLIVIISMLVDDITFPFGICLFIFALASLIGPTSVGYLYDVHGSYLPGFVLVGVLAILGAAFLPLAWWAGQRRGGEERKEIC